MKKKERKARRHTFRYRNTAILTLLVLVPVAIVATVNFCILYLTHIGTLQNDLRLQSEQALEILNSNLNSMAKLANQRRMDKVFSTEAQAKVGTVYFPIVQKLREDSLWTTFFSSVRYYNRESGLVYEMNCAQSADECFDAQSDRNSAYYQNDSLELQPWDRKTLGETGYQTRVMRVRHAEGESSGVLFAVPVEYTTGEAPLSYMLFILSDRMLDNQIGASEGTTCVLYYQDAPIYSSDPEIQEQIYEGRSLPAAFSSSDVMTFESDAVRIDWKISSNFQIQQLIPTIILESIVTFIVMAIGLTVMLYVSRRSYQPIRNLLRKLPPPDETGGPLDELKYIDFMMDDFAFSKRFFEESVQELRREKYLFYILDNQVKPGEALYQQCLHEGIRVDRKYFACILMEDSEKNYELFDRITSGPEEGETPIDTYSLYILGNKYLFLLASDRSKEDFSAYLATFVEKENDLVRVSEVIEGVENVRKAYTSVCWPERKEPDSAENSASSYPVVEFQLLQEAMETSNLDKAEFALRMLKSDLGAYNKETRSAVVQHVRSLVGETEEIPADSRGERQNEEYSQALDDVLRRLVQDGQQAPDVPKNLQKTQPRNLHTIMRYIEEHYTDPNFSIKYMACVFDTSPSNLSHQFKKLTGKTLSRFIDELRISKAEELLAQGEKVHVVAQKLGYSTTPVFTETYKRIRGMTPSSYRNQSQQTK